MNCTECATPMHSRRENYRYEECGLRHVTLVGLAVVRCRRCGNFEIAIPKVEELHRVIAQSVIEKTTRLTGEEVRFLRKRLGWSGAVFARHMGVSSETVSRWENDATPIGPQADRLLRLLVVKARPSVQYPTERLASIDAGKATATRLDLRSRGDHWELRSA